MRSSLFIGVFFLACLPTGCANWQARQSSLGAVEAGDSLTEAVPRQMMAADFVYALKQIPSLPPAMTTVQLLYSDRDDAFTLRMRDALQSAGYGIHWVTKGTDAQLFQYRHEGSVDQGAVRQDLYEIAVGSVELRRRYAIDDKGRVSPATPLYVRGADASAIRMNDSVFEWSNEAPHLAVGATSRPSVSSAEGQPQARARSTLPGQLSVPREANPLNPLISGTDRNRGLSLPLVALPRIENVFELGGSNFENYLADHLLVREQVLIFPNDSLRLGDVNKNLLEQMIKFFNPETDVFSVLGCSLGPTQLTGGNAALALGRASRVKEALLFAGVPQDQVLDEGCWAGDGAGEALPRRGVVVAINRKV